MTDSLFTTTSRSPSLLDPAFEALLDRVGERQRADFGHMASSVKADGSLITACDRWSDATLVEGLADLFPREGVLSEEGSQLVPRSAAYWVVDPLDGTTNFAAGIPYWAISLARFEHGLPVLAVLDVPPLRQRIVAVRGRGAWRNGKPLHPPSIQTHPVGCASLCSRSIGVLQKLPDQRFPGKIRLLGGCQPEFGQRGDGPDRGRPRGHPQDLGPRRLLARAQRVELFPALVAAEPGRHPARHRPH